MRSACISKETVKFNESSKIDKEAYSQIVDTSLFYCRGCLTQEKIVASCADTFIVVADERSLEHMLQYCDNFMLSSLENCVYFTGKIPSNLANRLVYPHIITVNNLKLLINCEHYF